MPGLASASFRALGTTAVVMTDRERLVQALDQVERELDDIDRTCSRFRADSDLSRVNGSNGTWIVVDPLLMAALEVALRAAAATDGTVDPTVGAAVIGTGYDRDFDEIARVGPAIGDPKPAPGWHLVELDPDRCRVRVRSDVELDLGATAKALAADRAAERAARATGRGVLVSLGGDVSTAGDPPPGGWTIGIADDHAALGEPGESIAILSGGLATSSTTVRRWTRGGMPMHHIVDPRTGLPAPEVWRTVSVAAASCVDANTASTASFVLGERAPAWLDRLELPARLVRPDGSIVRVAAWPRREAA